MKQDIVNIALVVDDYDKAIEYFAKALGFELIEDSDMGDGKRWVVVSPKNSSGTKLLLAKAKNEKQNAAIGNQCGGRVFLFLETDDFARDYQRMSDYGVAFCEQPRDEVYGKVVVFEDLYGNKWDLIERKR